MSIKLADLAHRIESIFQGAAPIAGAVATVANGTPAGAIANIVLAIPQMMDLAEELIDAPGPVKLAAVKASVQASITEVAPDAGTKLTGIMALLGPAISMIHAARKLGIHI